MPRYTSGGVRIAYHSVGFGDPPLVVTPGWASHLEVDWGLSEARHFYHALAHGRRVVRYDKRGTGLSDRAAGPEAYSVERQSEDLEAVLDAARIRSGVVMGWSMSGPIAVELAARKPERVRGLVLYATYARLTRTPDHPIGAPPERGRALTALLEADWELGNRALAARFVSEQNPARVEWFARYARLAASPATYLDYLRAAERVDVRERLAAVHCPTLVLCRRDDTISSVEQATYLAQRIPNAHLKVLEGDEHFPWWGRARDIVDAVDRFCSGLGGDVGRAAPEALTPREREILVLLSQGLTNVAIAARLGIAEPTVARHVANLYGKLGVSSRAAATAFAIRAGIA